MKREKLIEEVRKFPYLYDLSDSKYNNNIKKDQAWKEISITYESESKCKKTWMNLRESHRRAMKKRKTKSGQAATTVRKWIFEDEMSFLVPHYRERSRISSVDDDDGSDVSSNLNDNSQNSLNEIVSPDNEQTETLPLTSRPKSPASSVNSNIPKKSKKSCKVENNSASETLMKYLIDEKKNNEEDEIDTFFKSIAATVKKFSEYNQAVIKTKIYSAVSEMELKEITDKQNYYSYGNPFISQTHDYMSRSCNTLNQNSHENQSVPTTSSMQKQTSASNTDDFNISNFEENNQ